MRLIHNLSIPSFLSLLVLTACVAKDPDSLGDLETGNDSGASESGDEGATSEPTGATASGSETGEPGETGEPVDPCRDPGLEYQEPATCPDELTPVLPAAGCYEPCNGPADACSVGTCTEVQVNPCVCAEGEDCCAACGSLVWLCVEGLADLACEAVVGATFASVEDLECGLGPKGPVSCNWTITFEEDGDYLWQYSDVGQGGTYTCEGGVITVGNDPSLEASYDLATATLTWDGVAYQLVPTE